jgi:hypothetical protein
VFGDPKLHAELYKYLERFPTLRNCISTSANSDYLRVRFAPDLGRVAEAEVHFRTGLERSTRPDVRFLIDAGRNHQGLAEVGERRRNSRRPMSTSALAAECSRDTTQPTAPSTRCCRRSRS